MPYGSNPGNRFTGPWGLLCLCRIKMLECCVVQACLGVLICCRRLIRPARLFCLLFVVLDFKLLSRDYGEA
jgi:hypothetical protein